jgi:predicted ATP-grasp superfamily ATP-dependent carboligase
MIDPKYAEQAIKSLNTLLHFNIDTKELEKEAKLIEVRIKEIIKKHTDSHEDYKKALSDSGPSMYA